MVWGFYTPFSWVASMSIILFAENNLPHKTWLISVPTVEKGLKSPAENIVLTYL